jgi:hypothetical protein
MYLDNISPPGSWKEEILNGPATPTQLREIISDLEHLLRLSRAECETLSEQNSQLMNQLTDSVAAEMKARAHAARLKQEVKTLWIAISRI